MMLEYTTEDSCILCGGKMFRFLNPERYVCLRQKDHAQYLAGKLPGRKRNEDENDICPAPGQVPYLRDAAVFRGDDMDLPEQP